MVLMHKWSSHFFHSAPPWHPATSAVLMYKWCPHPLNVVPSSPHYGHICPLHKSLSLTTRSITPECARPPEKAPLSLAVSGAEWVLWNILFLFVKFSDQTITWPLRKRGWICDFRSSLATKPAIPCHIHHTWDSLIFHFFNIHRNIKKRKCFPLFPLKPLRFQHAFAFPRGFFSPTRNNLLYQRDSAYIIRPFMVICVLRWRSVLRANWLKYGIKQALIQVTLA